MRLKAIFIFFMIAFTHVSNLFADFSSEQLARRIQAHLIIRDPYSARLEAEAALTRYPQDGLLWEQYLRVLAQLGDEKAVLKAWEQYILLFPEKKQSRVLIEDIAWGVLHKASQSSSIITREMALLAAYFSQEGQSVHILLRGLRDSNYAVREIAVKLASHFRDSQLVHEIKRLFYREKVWMVRQQVIQAIGKMQMKEMQQPLEQLIASESSLAEEKALAIAALLEMLEKMNRGEIESLVSSSRAGLRQLACQAIAYFQSVRDLDQLFILAQDSHPSVRSAAFQAIGQLHPKEFQEKIIQIARQGIQEVHPSIALSSAWLLTIYLPQEGQNAFHRFLVSDRSETRLLATAALAATGSYGLNAILHYFHHHADPYVQLNLALALIGQEVAEEEALDRLNQLFFSEKEKWVEKNEGIFSAITGSRSSQLEDPLESPESENQLLRLELLNLLAMRKYPGAEHTIRQFLLEKTWGISATAAALLLTEGDEEAIHIVEDLLQDPQPVVRLQAALILSLWSREESAIQTLQENYTNSSREDKAKILESLGRIGSMNSISFLLEVLKEPSQTLRLIGALALIQCLNH